MKEKESKLSIAGFVFGLGGVFTSFLWGVGLIPSIIGLIVSIICMSKKSQPKSGAIPALVVSICGFLMSLAGIIFAGYLVSEIVTDDQGMTVNTQELDVFNTSWACSRNNSRLVFGVNNEFNWYIDPDRPNKSYVQGTYYFFNGLDAVSYLTYNLSEFGITEEDVYELIESGNYSLEEFVCMKMAFNKVVIADINQAREPEDNYYYGFIAEDGTVLEIMNIETADHYSFIKE